MGQVSKSGEGELAFSVHESEPRFLIQVRTPDGVHEAEVDLEYMESVHKAIGEALAMVKSRGAVS